MCVIFLILLHVVVLFPITSKQTITLGHACAPWYTDWRSYGATQVRV